MGKYNMAEDLPRGRKVERVVAQYFLSNGKTKNVEFAPDRKFSDWDLCCKNEKDTEYIEVKEDQAVAKYGNLFVETSSRNNLTGISVTKANFYVFVAVLHDVVEFYKIPIEKLKTLLSKGSYKEKCGDKHSNTCRIRNTSILFS